MRKSSLKLNSSSQAINNSGSGIHEVGRSGRHKWSFTGSHGRKNLVGGSKSKFKETNRSDKIPRRELRVLDEDGNDVTPLRLDHADPGDMQPKPGRFTLNEIFPSSGSDHLKSFSCASLHSSRYQVVTFKLPGKRAVVKQHVTEEMLDELIHICLTETDTISLLDIPSTFVSEDDDDAEAIKKGNIQYAELCKNRLGNDKYTVRSMQTFVGAPKNKEVQCDKILMVDEGTTATVWDIYDSFHNQNETMERKMVDYPESVSKVQENNGEKSSTSTSTLGTGSIMSSLSEMEISGTSLNVEPDPQQIIQSESFQHSLLVMMRNLMANVFQPKLAAYRQLPILEDPDSTVKPGSEDQREDDETSCPTPALERLWAFTCELTRRWNITSMAWNKMNSDILAVGYGDCNSSCQKPGLICCWSLKNPLWPERVFHCHSCVTALDFSANNPSQLAVGMLDGTVALYNVQSQDSMACIGSSSECFRKHLHPVWQVTWIKQEMRLSGEERVEALVAVSADGRITKWVLGSNGLDCIDLMLLKEIKKNRTESQSNKKMTRNVPSKVTPGLCVDFHPTDSSIYLAGTWEGFIHKCSSSNRQHFLDTYKKHFCPVNHLEWSPFNPDVFLSCSSDWTIQLWKQDCFSPVLSFTSTQRAVLSVRWSPVWSTVFAAISGRQVEIWDLNTNILQPTIVHHAAPGVKMTALLFASGTNCVLVGDSDGQVTVYQLRNLSVGEGKQVDSLEDIIHRVVSRNL
ncbi:dynein intermediate chain 4, axonemal-like [Toxotes jaculatrix]|uniref:dynein intermediate chain 4, axonemal-like n=1 Tax=Toxotes jaculatrix TaxID=941984 RepID=UPI001B3AAEBD|nr:dynein intermediate chain 4, axonemal-like [Toxotes jaculatrix]